METHRHEFNPEDANAVWWKSELKRFFRITASVPVIMVFVAFLTVILTALFVFEAFITQLYTGPGKQYIVCYLVSRADSANSFSVAGTYRSVHGCCSELHGILPVCECFGMRDDLI